ncbi:hypothetical protein MHEL_29080 [Mycolicibacterium helvum]|uniref:Uncharacterized protein n=1 Tax=Mycolicibacterium helvum TaxID=1534349 RepID=A0A7I7T8N5_9MYCO|nr:hypothetical protein MHEL_29080 [Mycolicibacterium helvum]
MSSGTTRTLTDLFDESIETARIALEDSIDVFSADGISDAVDIAALERNRRARGR